MLEARVQTGDTQCVSSAVGHPGLNAFFGHNHDAQ